MSMLCEKADGGSVRIQKNELTSLFLQDGTSRKTKPILKYTTCHNQDQRLSIASRIPELNDATSDYGGVDQGALMQHSRKLGAWLSDKGVKNIQEKTDAQARKMKQEYSSLLDTENTFVKQLDDYVKYNKTLDTRKRDILHKRWTDEVYEPIRREIIKEMDGPNYCELERRKRELYREYLEFTNKKGHVFLDTYPSDEYYAPGLHATRPSPFKGLQAETQKLKDPLLAQKYKHLDEERILLRCSSGIRYTDKDIEKIQLPPLPLVPLGRQGTENSTWIRMELGDIESDSRKFARVKMRGTCNRVGLNLNEWATVPADFMAKVFDEELKISKKKRFLLPHKSMSDLSHKPFRPDSTPPLITSINKQMQVPGTALTV